MSGKMTEELLKADKEHIMHPAYPVGVEPPGIVWEKSHGLFLQDTEGKEYVDLSAQLQNVNLGHGRKEIIDAIVKQANELQFSALFFGISNRPSIECALKLAEVTPPGLKHFLFTAGGSEANDFAFKMARACWQSHGKNKFKIISLYHAYHGVTYGAMGATSIGGGMIQAGYEPITPGFIRAPSYYCYRCDLGMEYPSCGIQCAKYLEGIIQREGPQTVAAFIAEPMHGGGGVILPPPEYWPMVRKICTENDVLLIDDEVMTGFCRTGKMFALEHWGVAGDIMTMSKGIISAYLPFGAVAINDKVRKGLEGTLCGASSSCGMPICCAASSATIDVYVKDKIAEHAAKLGEHVKERLDAEFAPLPIVGDVRGLGLFLAIELVADKATKAMFDAATSQNVSAKLMAQLMEKGYSVRISGFPNLTVFITPPLTITTEEIDKALDAIYSVLAAFKPD